MREGKRWKVCSRCRQIKRKNRRNFPPKGSRCRPCCREAQAERHRQRRRSWNAEWHLDFEIRAWLRRVARTRRALGESPNRIAPDLGVSAGSIYQWTRDLRPSTESELISLHVDHGLAPGTIARLPFLRRGCLNEAQIRNLLKAAGVFQPQSRESLGGDAPEAKAQDLIRAAGERATRDLNMTGKQADLLNILRAAPRPLKTAEISRVASMMPRTGNWAGWDCQLASSLKRLVAKGYVAIEHKPQAGRHRRVTFWYATSSALSGQASENAEALIELRLCTALTVRGRRCRRPVSKNQVCHIHSPGWNPVKHIGEKHRRNDQQRSAEAAARRDRVVSLYEAGLTTQEIAEALDQSHGAAKNHILRLRKEGRIGRRMDRLDVDVDLAEQVRVAWVEEELSIRAIGERFEWDFNRTWSVIQRVREMGFDLPSRQGGPIDVRPGEKRKVRQRVRRRHDQGASAAGVPEPQKVVLRILEAAERPLSTVEVHRFVNLCGHKLSKDCIRGRLLRAKDAGHVDRATCEERRWFERGAGRWFIPVNARHSSKALTLADAERESELVALIDSQREEMQLGTLTKFEKGHWNRSLDAPVTEQGLTILDTLGDEDEALQELIGEPA